MATVINFDDECTQLAQTVKRGKAPCAIFSISSPSNACTIVPIPSPHADMSGQEKWEHFISALPKDSCGYGVAPFNYISPTDGVARSKTVFILWAPSRAPRKDKMMVAFSANGVVNKIGSGGIGCRVQAGGAHELEYEEVMNQVLSRSTVK